jgi:hypothetical protein
MFSTQKLLIVPLIVVQLHAMEPLAVAQDKQAEESLQNLQNLFVQSCREGSLERVWSLVPAIPTSKIREWFECGAGEAAYNGHLPVVQHFCEKQGINPYVYSGPYHSALCGKQKHIVAYFDNTYEKAHPDRRPSDTVKNIHILHALLSNNYSHDDSSTGFPILLCAILLDDNVRNRLETPPTPVNLRKCYNKWLAFAKQQEQWLAFVEEHCDQFYLLDQQERIDRVHEFPEVRRLCQKLVNAGVIAREEPNATR